MNFSPSVSPAPLPSRAARRRLWLARGVWLALVLSVGFIGWWGWRDDAISPANPESVPPVIVQGLKSFTVRRGGEKLWQFDAKSIEVSPDGTQTFASQVSNGILFRANKPFLYLRAPRVELKNLSSDVTARGGVNASGANRFSILSPVVSWNYAQKILSCPAPVRAQLRDFSLDAPHLRYNWSDGELRCDAPVALRAPGVELRSPRLRASTKTRVLDLGGGVALTFDTKQARPKQWRDLLVSP